MWLRIIFSTLIIGYATALPSNFGDLPQSASVIVQTIVAKSRVATDGPGLGTVVGNSHHKAYARVSELSQQQTRYNANNQPAGYTITEKYVGLYTTEPPNRWIPNNSYSTANPNNRNDQSPIYNRGPVTTRQPSQVQYQNRDFDSSSQFNDNSNRQQTQIQSYPQNSVDKENLNRQQNYIKNSQQNSQQNYQQNTKETTQFTNQNDRNTPSPSYQNDRNTPSPSYQNDRNTPSPSYQNDRNNPNSSYPDKIYFNLQQSQVKYPLNNANSNQQNYNNKQNEETTTRIQYQQNPQPWNQQNYQGNPSNQGITRNEKVNTKEQAEADSQKETLDFVTDYKPVKHPDQKYEISIQYPMSNFKNSELTTRAPLRRPQDFPNDSL